MPDEADAGARGRLARGDIRRPPCACRARRTGPAALAAADPGLRARIADAGTRASVGRRSAPRPTRWWRRGGLEEAVAVLRRAAAAARARRRRSGAGRAALRTGGGALAPDWLDAARAAWRSRPASALLGRYEDAARALETARAAAADGGDPGARAAEREAWLRARRGDTEGRASGARARPWRQSWTTLTTRRRRSCARASAGSARHQRAFSRRRSHTVAPLFDQGANVGDTARAVSGETRRTRLRVSRPSRARGRIPGAGSKARARSAPPGRRAYLGAAARPARRARGGRAARIPPTPTISRRRADGDVHTVASVALNLAGAARRAGALRRGARGQRAGRARARAPGRGRGAGDGAGQRREHLRAGRRFGGGAAHARTRPRPGGRAQAAPGAGARRRSSTGILALRSGQPKAAAADPTRAAATAFTDGGPAASRRERDVFGGGGETRWRDRPSRAAARARRGGRAAAADRRRRRARPGAGAARARRRRRGSRRRPPPDRLDCLARRARAAERPPAGALACRCWRPGSPGAPASPIS